MNPSSSATSSARSAAARPAPRGVGESARTTQILLRIDGFADQGALRFAGPAGESLECAGLRAVEEDLLANHAVGAPVSDIYDRCRMILGQGKAKCRDTGVSRHGRVGGRYLACCAAAITEATMSW
jgi:hypothetical protein